MFLKRSVLALIAATAWLAASASAQTSSTTFTRDFRFPPVGIASTETVQINVVNNATASSSGTAASCTGTITFTNASGTVIGTSSSSSSAPCALANSLETFDTSSGVTHVFLGGSAQGGGGDGPFGHQ